MLDDVHSSSRIGLTPDEALNRTWYAAQPPRYAAHLPGLSLLRGEVVALVGSGTTAVLDAAADALDACTLVEGDVAAAAGVLRIHAQQAARVGLQAIAVRGPFDAGLDPAGLALAVADLASVPALGLTAVVEVADVTAAALFADRVAVIRAGEVVVTYPVLAPRPRRRADVDVVTTRVAGRLARA